MIFGWSLRRRLVQRSPAGQAVVPVRAFGKLPIASEFIDVNCEDPPAARALRDWVVNGWRPLEESNVADRPALLPHHFAFSTDSRRAWSFGTIIASHDKPGAQGHRREYPFTLQVVLPAAGDRARPDRMLLSAGGFWMHLDALRSALLATADRAACVAEVRGARFALPPDVREQTDGALANIELQRWCAALETTPPQLAAALQATLARARANQQPVWRLPIAPRLPIGPQAAAWLLWLVTNLRPGTRELALLMESEQPTEACIVVGGFLPQHFRILSGGDRRAELVAHATRDAEPPADAAGKLAPTLERCRTLLDFARLRLPRLS